MALALNETLLEGDASSNPRGRRGLMVVALAALLLSAGYIGYALGTDNTGFEEGNDTIRAQLFANQTNLAVIAYSAQCYGFTGSTCLNSQCDSGQCVDGKCGCVNGGCTGIDGVCRRAQYEKVGGSFTMTNNKFPRSWLYIRHASLFSQLKVAATPSWTFGGAQNFDLYRLPGNGNEEKKYFLASSKWPNWVVTMRPTGSLATGSLSLFGLYAVNLIHRIAPWRPSQVHVQVCSLRKTGYPKQVMIGRKSDTLGMEWAYVHHGSWYVYGWAVSSDPGTGGYWTVDDDSVTSQLEDC